MADDESPKTVIVAVIANLVIAVAKFAAALVSGSSAMYSEGIHSLVDTGNEALLFLGLSRAKKPADVEHPFGYQKELYFWSLIVAVLLFGVGGGMSIYDGLHELLHPAARGSAVWSYIVLGIAAVAEGTSFTVAARAIRRKEIGDSFLNKLHHSKDPSRFAVVGEDSAALLGIATAAVGLGLGQLTNSPYPDAIASMVIGCILIGAAIYLIAQSKSLLIGESTDPRIVRHIQELVSRHPAVRRVRRPGTMHFGPEDVMLTLDITFHPMSSNELARAIDDLERLIRRDHPEMKRIYIEARLFEPSELARE
jgi:cation diffusion facilitator family transporter